MLLDIVDFLPWQDECGDGPEGGDVAVRFLQAGKEAVIILHEPEQILDLPHCQ